MHILSSWDLEEFFLFFVGVKGIWEREGNTGIADPMVSWMEGGCWGYWVLWDIGTIIRGVIGTILRVDGAGDSCEGGNSWDGGTVGGVSAYFFRTGNGILSCPVSNYIQTNFPSAHYEGSGHIVGTLMCAPNTKHVTYLLHTSYRTSTAGAERACAARPIRGRPAKIILSTKG